MKIRLARKEESNKVFDIYLDAKQKLEESGIYQWNDYYPTLQLIENDIENRYLYVIEENNLLYGAVNISEIQEKAYAKINWEFTIGKVLVVHRLVISPHHRGVGLGRQLMDYVEQYALINDYASIRLDVYSKNELATLMYKKRGYLTRGTVSFPKRTFPFYCMEKEIKSRL